MLHKHNISVQRNSSLKRPASRLSCFVCFVQQVLGKKLVVALAEKSSLQSSVLNRLHSALDSSRMQSYNSFSDRAKYKESVSNSNSSNLLTSQNLSKKVVVKLQHSKFSVLESEKPNNDWFSMFNLCLRQFYFIQLIIGVIQTLEQFCVDSPVCFLIGQIFCDSVVTTIHNLIAVGAVGKQFHCFCDNTRVWILVSFSTGTDCRLHKFIETFNWSVFNEAINLFASSPNSK